MNFLFVQKLSILHNIKALLAYQLLSHVMKMQKLKIV